MLERTDRTPRRVSARQSETDLLLAEVLGSLAPAPAGPPLAPKPGESLASELSALSRLLADVAEKLKDFSPALAPAPVLAEPPPAPPSAPPAPPPTLPGLLQALIDLSPNKPAAAVLDGSRIGLVFDWGQKTVEELLPVLAASAQLKSAPPPPAAPPAPAQEAQVLVVEDDAITRALLRNVLKRLPNTRIIEAVNGRAAWDLLDAGLLPDLCISDVMMPEMTGIKLLQKIRADHRFKAMEVILCTSVCDRETVTKAAALQVDYVLKPFASNKVFEKVEKAIARSQSKGMSAMEEVKERLGLDSESYYSLMEELTSEISSILTSIRSDMTLGDLASAATKINGLRGASLNIGDHMLAEVASAAEIAIASSDFEKAMAALERIEGENQRLKLSLAKLPKLAPPPEPAPVDPEIAALLQAVA